MSTSPDTSDWNPGDPIGYIRSEIPAFDVPPVTGERTEALVPDTLDLADSARLAIHAMTENPNPEADYEPYWSITFVPEPRMAADFASPSITPKFQEAVCLSRLVSGSEQNLHVDRRWMEVCLHQQGDDGLIYTPTVGRPWTRRFKPSSYAHGEELFKDVDQVLSPFICGQMLRTTSLYAARDPSGPWVDSIRKITDGLRKLAVDGGDYAYYWPGPIYASWDRPADVKPCYQYHMVEMSLITSGLLRAYRQAGYEPALDLAQKLNTFYRKTFFTPDGAFLTTQTGSIKSHVHGHARGLHAMADLGLITDDRGLLDFVIQSYEWTKSSVETLTGFTPNIVPSPRWTEPAIPGEIDPGTSPSFVNMDEFNGCEIMGLADMIGVALWLSDAGIADYWDDVDRWTRNMLTGSQMRHIEWIDHLPGSVLSDYDGRGDSVVFLDPQKSEPGSTTDRVAERNLGSWPTGAAPNDWCHDESGGFGFGLVLGDTAAGARALYWIWNRILSHQDGKLQINLLLNRVSKWADIQSCIPFQGRVDVIVKQPADLSIRIAEWTQPHEARIQVDGSDRNITWNGRYAQVGRVDAGQTVTLTFPIEERQDVVHVQKRRYTLVRRGNDVVSIYPRGKYYPFYQRDHDRTSDVRWRKKTQFVGEEMVDW